MDAKPTVPESTVPGEIVAEDKDWTWVLERPCPECGADVSGLPAREVAGMIRANAAAWSDALSAPVGVRERPRPDRWSPLEYGAHVRDVYRLFHERLRLMLDEDDPMFGNWDQDETARRERYGEQDPATVAAELRAAADVLADAFDGVSGEVWRRPGRRSDGSVFTVETFARYLIHDPVHHLWDVRHLRDVGGPQRV